jgi:cytoskeleton-associated protein 5
VYTSIESFKSPKLVADALLWMNQSVQEFGLIGLDLKRMVAFLDEQLKNNAAPVRAHSIALIVVIKKLGQGLLLG